VKASRPVTQLELIEPLPAATLGRALVRERPLLLVVALGTMLAPLNSTMIAVALPSLAAEFGVGIGSSGWLVVGYLIAMAAVQPIGGGLGDTYGRRRVFLGALVAFLAVSAVAVFAPTFEALIALRLGQALCGALAIPNGAALLREWVPAERRGAAYGLIGAAAGVAAGLGPPLAGLLIGLGGWRAIFVASLPLAIASLVIGWAVLPQVALLRPPARFDLTGAALLAAWLTGLALTASSVRAPVVGLPITVLALATVGLLAAFYWREIRTDRPVVQLRLFQKPTFAAAAVVIALGNLAMYSTLLTVPQFLSLVERRSSSEIGLVLAALSVPMVVLAPFAGRLADKRGRRAVALTGSVLTAAALTPLLWLGPTWPPWLLAVPLALAGCGLALQGPAVQAAAIESAPLRHAGMASGVFSTSRYLGSIVGSALLAALLAAGASGTSAVFMMVEVAALGALVAAALMSEGSTADSIPN
jgi:EmrB/QacA subfamily drug resistance transporter